MFRKIALLAISVISVTMPLAAQQRVEPHAERGPGWMGSLAASLGRVETEVRGRSSVLKRDSFIVSQLVLAAAELEDFQRNAAIEKARTRVEAARKRATENPMAPVATFELIATIDELLAKARQQGSMADLPALRRDILRRLHPLQQLLFVQIDAARKDRQAIADLQAKLINLGAEVDDGMTEAMRSTIDFFRAGGE